MIKQSVQRVLLSVCVLAIFGCGGGDGDGGDNGGGGIQPPEVAALLFPDKDAECNQGSVVSETESNVMFEWAKAANATSYTVVLTNLNTGATEEITSNNTSTNIKILRGTPYSWHVVSKSNKTTTTADSETWRFYNAGEGISNYAPFPAEVVSPTMGQTVTGTSLSLEWSGSDIDNDIEDYKVYMGTSNPPTTIQATTTTGTTAVTGLTSGTVYYWKVVTTDTHGNNSSSQVFEFRTE